MRMIKWIIGQWSWEKVLGLVFDLLWKVFKPIIKEIDRLVGEAQRKFPQSGKGAEKFDYVTRALCDLYPAWATAKRARFRNWLIETAVIKLKDKAGDLVQLTRSVSRSKGIR